MCEETTTIIKIKTQGTPQGSDPLPWQPQISPHKWFVGVS